MKKLLFLFFIFTAGHPSFILAQSNQLDSLFELLSYTNEDSTKVDILDRIANTFYVLNEMDSATIYVGKAIQLAERNKFTDRKMRGIYLKGKVLRIQEKDSLALEHLLEAKSYYERSAKRYDQFYMHLFLGSLFEKIGHIDRAVIHFDSAEIKRAKGNLRQAYDLNVTLGVFFWERKKYEKAKQKFVDNIGLSRKMKDSSLLFYAYADLGSLYNDLGKPDSSVYFLEMVLPELQKYDPYWTACLQGCLGTNYKSLGKCKQALEHFEKSLVNNKNPDASFKCSSFADMASCYLQLGNMEKAKYYNDLAIQYLDQAVSHKLKRDAFKEIISFYKAQNDYELAFLNLESLKQLEDELFEAENNAAIEELQVKYQIKERETQMELQKHKLNRQSTFIFVAVVLLVLLLLILFLGWRNALYRKKTNQLLSERNEHLEELDLKKSRFFSNISHELRTPLTLVTAPLEMTLDEVKDKKVRENLQIAHNNSKKLFVLVDEILDLSKLESGQMQLHFSEIRLGEALRRIFFTFQSLADIRQLKLEYNSNLPDDIWAKTDLAKLEKILNNLLSNAIKYSYPGGKVRLDIQYDSSRKGHGKFVLRLSDTGRGIADAELPKIFNRFYQSNTGRLVGGTGIGLALTKELVHLLDGKISVKSTLGKGSTFTLTLPFELIKQPQIHDHQSATKKETPEIVHTKPMVKSYTPLILEGQKASILIVEDNPEMSRFLVQTLSPIYNCTIAYDGNEALNHLESTPFDLVTSDVMMPQMDGFEFLEKVRKEGTVFKHIPFILLTARSLEKDKLDGFQLGVDDYITKPFSVKELIARIQNLLKNKKEREASKIEESIDKKMLKKAEQIVLNHISESDFDVHQLSAMLTMSQRSMERSIKSLTGFSPVGFIREIRLQKAYQFLKRRQFLTVTEVRYAVGIENASYFNRKFKERFGVSPKEVMGKMKI